MTDEGKGAAAADTAAAAEKATQEAAAAADASKATAAAAAKAGDSTKSNSSAGDAYTALALPKDSSLDPSALDRLRAMATTHKLTPEAAQAVVDAMNHEVLDVVGVVGEAFKPDGEAWKERVAGFKALSLAAADLGNGSPRELEAVQLRGELFLNREAPELKKVLHEAGLLTHPDVLRFLQKRVAERGEDKLVFGDKRPPPAKPAELRDRYEEDGSPKKGASTSVA